MHFAKGHHAQPLRDQTHRELVYCPFQFHERGQYFIGADDEAVSVAMPAHYPNRSDFKINCRDNAPANEYFSIVPLAMVA